MAELSLFFASLYWRNPLICSCLDNFLKVLSKAFDVVVFTLTRVSPSVSGDTVLISCCAAGVMGSSWGSSILTLDLGRSFGDALSEGSLSLVLSGEVFLVDVGLSISIPVVFRAGFFLTSFGVTRERRLAFFLGEFLLCLPSLVVGLEDVMIESAWITVMLGVLMVAGGAACTNSRP